MQSRRGESFRTKRNSGVVVVVAVHKHGCFPLFRANYNKFAHFSRAPPREKNRRVLSALIRLGHAIQSETN